ncbi:MAG: phosphoglucosamine mutase [Pseudomonadota bacterium]
MAESKRKYFGTDGVRGTVGEAPITPEFMLKLAWAAGQVLARHGQRKVVIGKDTRISGYMFESVMEAGLSAAGIDSILLGPMPTPGIAYLTRTLHADAGIVISASHNPYFDNGIKFFSSQGTKLPDDVEMEIEAQLELPMTTVDSARLGRATRMGDAAGRYIEFCKSTIPMGTSLKGMTVVVDCAHGATYHITPSVFRELGAKVITTGAEPNGLNINLECGSTHPEALQALVLEHKADMGVALDGDGDRCIMVDHRGEVVDGDELLYIIAQSRVVQGRLKGGVVGTLMSNFGLEYAIKSLGIDFVRAKVGDRYVLELLHERRWMLGGESSGHLICLDRTSTGDGIVSALQVCEAMVSMEKSLHDLKSGMRKFPQHMINVKISGKIDVVNHPEVLKAVRETEQRLNGKGRVLLRPSGTEPVVRVMVEGEQAEAVSALAHALADVVRQVVGKAA